jgi:hypothetical protein
MPGSYRGEDRRRESVGWTGPERRSRFAPAAGGQLLEEGAVPSGPTDQLEDNPNEFTSDGGEGTDTPMGGAATLGGGIFEDQGSEEDAPRYGDWTRHSTGTTSGARGHEGVDFPGENTWGEEEAERERRSS